MVVFLIFDIFLDKLDNYEEENFEEEYLSKQYILF